jgi:hypothetical protein
MSWPSVELISLAGLFLGIIGAVLALMMLLITRNRLSHYERAEQRAVLSEMRNSFEQQIAKLSAQMTATEERWRDANHLIISAQKGPAQNETFAVQPENEFLRGFHLRAPDYVVDPKLILVLTPFADEERETFEVIQKTCVRNGFRCLRGDEEYAPSDVLAHVIQLIVKARIVVANVTSRNPNVFYELGIAHALGKQTILVARGLEAVPFDIARLRILIWHNFEELERRLTETLLRTIAETRVVE